VSESRPFISFAQHGEDVILWRALGDRDSVTYVDVGAFDPTYDSVTRALYERGWRGVNIEPQPDRLEAFIHDRPEDVNLCLAVGDRDGVTTLSLGPIPGWATALDPVLAEPPAPVTSTLEVPMRCLATLLPELGIEHVDVLKIDVEGTEPAVVRGLLDGAIRPLVCVVEGVAPGLGRSAGDEAVALLVAAGYEHCLFDGLNHYLTIDPALRTALSTPANPLDGHTTVALVRFEHERQLLQATIAALATENVALRAPSESASGTATSAPDDTASAETSDLSPLGPDRLADEPGSAEDSDLPLPTTDSPADLEDTRTEAAAPPPAPILLDADIRAQRRRATFAALLKGDRAELPRTPATALARLLRLAVAEHTPAEAITVLYREILGRTADQDGIASWTRLIESGEPLLKVAHELANSREALEGPRDRRQRVRSDLIAWESLVAVTELGLAAWRPGYTYTPGSVEHEVLIAALFEVAMQRPPTASEMTVETEKLASGVGREWMVRAYAAKPEVKRRLLGLPARGPRGRLRRWRGSRTCLATFRELVALAEARQVAQLLANLSDKGTDIMEIAVIPSPNAGGS
jgi:FkbM family methyltransferase